MNEAYELKNLKSDCKMALIMAPVLFVIGCLLLLGGWKEMFIGIFFILGSFVLIGVYIDRRKKLKNLLTSYLEKKLNEYFGCHFPELRFVLRRNNKLKYSYYIYVNGYVNKEHFEMFMSKIKEEITIKFEHRLLRKPKNSIK